MKILVADDEPTGRRLLERLLEREGHEVVLAENGREAVEVFYREAPDLVLMDVMMPEMDGYEATRRIKSEMGEILVPVIFLTAVTDEGQLAECVECGGDDFLTKPYSRTLLRAKISSLTRLRGMQAELADERDRVRSHRQRLVHEQEVAEGLFRHIVHRGCLDLPHVRYLISPMAIFNGDLVLAARRPGAGQHFLIGDFTGHGLPAAIGAIPIADVFYAMTAKGASLQTIVPEMNRRLREVLPVGMFFSAAAMSVDPGRRCLRVWNGGAPDVIVRSDAGIRHRFGSRHPPLGVIPETEMDSHFETIELVPDDRVYFCSDGIIEARSPSGEPFGEKALETILDTPGPSERVFDQIVDAVGQFTGGLEQSDDVTLVEVTCVLEIGRGEATYRDQLSEASPPTTWRLDLRLDADSLRRVDPIPHLLGVLADVQGLRRHQQTIYTVMAELYANALDHGVLRCDSSLRATPEGSVRYFEDRTRRLDALQTGWIRFELRHAPKTGGGGRLEIRVVDSGAGFDYQTTVSRLEDNTSLHGRGIGLITQLCSQVEFVDPGNEVRVVYEWSD